MKNKILILGSSGLLGRKLCDVLKKDFDIFGHIHKKDFLNMFNEHGLSTLIKIEE